ncbi:hypothetical protein C8R45DRAFT_1011930 [Mycena sanguinolenta]|nr:hypothetical protein C8R45DRAFT_1011930 [Mycena sanguinolenta]
MEIYPRKAATRPVYPSRPVLLALPSHSALLRNLNSRAFHGPPRTRTDGGTEEEGVEMSGKTKRRRSGQQGDEGEERMTRKIVEKARTEHERNRAEPTGKEQGRWGRQVGREGTGREIDGRSVVKGARIGRSDVHLYDVSKSARGQRRLRAQR